MSSKGKTEDDDTKDIKMKFGIDILSCIEEERQKLLADKESIEDVEYYVHQQLEWLAFEPSSLFYNYHLKRNGMTDFDDDMYSPLPATTRDCLYDGHLLRFLNFENEVASKKFSSKKNEKKSQKSLFETPDSDSTWGPHFTAYYQSKMRIDSLGEKLVKILRNWNQDLYQNCIDEYNILKKKSLEIWSKVVLQVFLSIMLDHCLKSDIIADFFHTLCSENNKLITNIIVKLKPPYLNYFLMNMAAVNRVECSMVLDSCKWNLAKKELVESAFRLGQIENMRLLLRYFRPNDYDLWTSSSSQIGRVTVNGVLSGNNIRKKDDYRGFNLRNLLQMAVCVSLSRTSHDVLANGLRLYWRASTMPFITPDYIDKAFNLIHYDDRQFTRSMAAFKDTLFKVYPKDCFGAHQPRSLMHLSRCKVRQSLTSGFCVPLLPLPNKLKTYINLEW